MEIGPGRLVLEEWPWCFPCGTSIGRGPLFSTTMWHAGHKVRNRPRGWSAPLCVSQKVISVKRARERRVEGGIRLSVGGCNRLQRRALNLGAANQRVGPAAPHPRCIWRRKISEVQQTQAAANV